jgi:hypothetical protein
MLSRGRLSAYFRGKSVTADCNREASLGRNSLNTSHGGAFHVPSLTGDESLAIHRLPRFPTVLRRKTVFVTADAGLARSVGPANRHVAVVLATAHRSRWSSRRS